MTIIQWLLMCGGTPTSRVLLHFDATNGTQTTTEVNGQTVQWVGALANIQITNAASKFGAASLITGNGDTYIYINPLTSPITANTPWTAECFINCGTADAFLHNILSVGNASHGIAGMAAWRQAGAPQSSVRTYFSNNGSTWNLSNGTDYTISAGSNLFSDGAWHHCSIRYTGTAFKISWDGTDIATIASATCPQITWVRVGSDDVNVRSLLGYIDEFRLAPWDTNGVVPSAAYPA